VKNRRSRFLATGDILGVLFIRLLNQEASSTNRDSIVVISSGTSSQDRLAAVALPLTCLEQEQVS